MAVVHQKLRERQMPMAVARAAIVFCVAVAPPVVFQFLLALGAPWGALTMGGINPGQLPPAMRLNAVLSALILCGTALVVCVRAGLVLPGRQDAVRRSIWAVVLFCVLEVVLHVLTPSYWERVLWLPCVSIMLVASSYVAMGTMRRAVDGGHEAQAEPAGPGYVQVH